MREQFEQRLRALARRAGLTAVPTPVLVAAMVLVSVAVVAALLRWWPNPADADSVVVSHATVRVASGSSRVASRASRSASASEGESAAESAAQATSSGVCVDVVGAVRQPGVFRLPADSRVEAAVDAAGGMTSDAARFAINLAAKLQDGEQVVVPTKAEAKAGGLGGTVAAGVAGGGAGTAAGAGGSRSAVAPGSPIDLNTADATQLDALPGVGPATAAKIVADRQANGPFKTAEDLGRVPGIGPKKLDQLKPLICVR